VVTSNWNHIRLRGVLDDSTTVCLAVQRHQCLVEHDQQPNQVSVKLSSAEPTSAGVCQVVVCMLRVIFCTDADVDGGGGEGSQKNMDDVLKLTRETLNVSKTLSKTVSKLFVFFRVFRVAFSVWQK